MLNKIDEKTKELIVKDYFEDVKVNEITKKYKISKTLLYKFVSPYKYRLQRKFWKRLNLANKIIHLRKKGKSIREISKELNLSFQEVYRYLEKYASTLKNIHKVNYGRMIKSNNVKFFEKIDTEEKAYWLGFIYADGAIGKDRCRLQIILQEKDKEHLKKFAKIFNRQIRVWDYYDKRHKKIYKFASFSINHPIIKENLEYWLNDKTKILEKIPDNLINHFIRGFLDGDGCICISYVSGYPILRVSFCGTFEFLKALKIKLVNKLKVKDLEIKKSKKGKIYIIGWSSKDSAKICKFIYDNATIYLERKKERYDEWLKLKELK